MSKKKLVIFGSGKAARLVDYYFTNESEYEVVAFCASKEYCKDEHYLDRPLISFDDIEKEYPHTEYSMHVAVGYTKLNTMREYCFNLAKKKGYTLVSYISPKANYCNDLVIGENCFIMPQASIHPFVKLGNDVFVLDCSCICHDVVVGDHVFIASGATIAGLTSIGSRSFIGANSTIRDMLNIGSDCLIGCGATITKNTMDNEVYISERTKPRAGKGSDFL